MLPPVFARLLFLFVCSLSLCGGAFAQLTGANDPTFNPGDPGFGYGDGPNGQVNCTLLLPDGKMMIGGSFTTYNGQPAMNLARITYDGQLDTTFHGGGAGSATQVNQIIQQPDGKFLLGGYFGTYNGVTARGITRINPDGSRDVTFNTVVGPNNWVLDIALLPSGKILVAGAFTLWGGQNKQKLTRLNPTGTLDQTFIFTGASGWINDIELLPDGNMLVSGDFDGINGSTRRKIARLLPDGAVDLTFSTGIGPTETVYGLVRQPDDKLLIYGSFLQYSNLTRRFIARIQPNGDLDSSFVPGIDDNIIAPMVASVHDLILLPDGKIIVAGIFNNYSGTPRRCITRINSDGSLDPSFNPGTGFDQSIYVARLLPDGKYLIGGAFTTYKGETRRRIMRMYSDGTRDLTFNPGAGANAGVSALGLQPDGKIIAGGNFTSYNDVTQQKLMRIHPDGSLDPSFSAGSGPDNAVNSIAVQPDGKILIAGAFTTYNGTTKNRVARLNANGTLDATFTSGTGPNTTVNEMALLPDGKIILVGNFVTYNGTTTRRMVRLNANGTIDPTFTTPTAFTLEIKGIMVQPDGKLIVYGDFSMLQAYSRRGIGRLFADGTVDPSFDPGVGYSGGSIRKCALQADGKVIITGSFTTYNGIPVGGIVRLNADGTLDTTFITGTGITGNVNAMIAHADGKLTMAGAMSAYNGTALRRIVQLDNNGAINPFFNTGTGTDSTISALLLQNDGKLVIAGEFFSYRDVGRNRMARILNPQSSSSTISPVACGSYLSPAGHTYTTSGTYIDHIANSVGGDSSITIHLTVHPVYATTQTVTICDSSFTWVDGNEYSASTTTPTYTFTTAHGCDSVVTLHLTITHATGTATVTACESYTWIDGNIYNASTNTPTFLLSTAAGCDSLVTLHLTITHANTGIATVTACDSYTWIDGNVYNASTNTPTFTLTNAAGCDSVVTLHLTVNHSTSGIETVTACNSYNWIDGNAYFASTSTPTYTLTNAAGCDSVVTLHLTINHANTGIDVVTACDSYIWADGNSYTESTTTPVLAYTNAAGCDSIVTLHLTITHSTGSTQVVDACGSYNWIDGVTYMESTNAPTMVYTNAAGCDSIVTLDLTIHPITSTVQTVTHCGPYTWSNGITYSASTTTPTQAFLSSAGCDSVVTLHLTILEVPVATITDNGDGSLTAAGGTSCVWLSCTDYSVIAGATELTFFPEVDGMYTAIVSNADGCQDTTLCLFVDVLGVNENELAGVAIFPNPAQESVTVQFAGGQATLLLRDAQGKLLRTFTINSGATIPVAELSTGVYFFELQTGNGSTVRRLVKQ